MGIGVRNVLTRRKGVRGFRSALMRCKLAWDGARRFGIGKSGSGMVLIAKASTQIMVPIITVLDMSTPEVVCNPSWNYRVVDWQQFNSTLSKKLKKNDLL